MEQLTEEEKTKITEMANKLGEKTFDFMLENLPEQKDFANEIIMLCAALGVIFSLGKSAHGKNKSEQELFLQFVLSSLKTNFKKFNES